MDKIKALIERVRNEPVLLTQAVAVLFSLAAVFGFSLPVATAAAIMGAAQFVAAMIGRAQVTPTRTLAE